MNGMTFCISTYNNNNYLQLAIKSVRENSHFKDAPFVIYAENCNDGTNEWLEENNITEPFSDEDRMAIKLYLS